MALPAFFAARPELLNLEAIRAERQARLLRRIRSGEFKHDPLGFVMAAYPWGKGQLQHDTGPDDNQRDFLVDLGKETKARAFNGSDPVTPVRMAATKGHGVGFSTLGAWIANWILSTRPHSVGTITAGTYTQLETRTWAAILRWTKICVTASWFDIRVSGIYAKEDPEFWKITPQTCKEENAQSFAGQHAKNSTSWFMFDEGSEVGDKIYETAEGGITDGEPMMFAWGQPVRNSGKLFRVCFGSENRRWNVRRIDSRKSKFTNKVTIDQAIEDYGIDSDHVRVRVLGLPPRASELQYIDQTRVNEAQKRDVFAMPDEPLICGVDVSGGGAAWTVARFRKGFNGRILPPVRITGEQSRNRDVVLARLAEILRENRPGFHVDMMFIDSAFGSPYVVLLQRLGFKNVVEVTFGGPSPDNGCLNHRAFMWKKTKEWLPYGGIFSQEQDHKFESDLTAPGYHINSSSKLVIESKEKMMARGVAPVDDGDAFVLTFAMPVALIKKPTAPLPAAKRQVSAWG